MTTFPLPVAEFFAGLKIAEIMLYPHQPRNVTTTEGGAVFSAGRGVALWRGTVSLVPGYHATQAAVEALIDVASRPGASFLAHDSRLNGPQADPGGAGLTGLSPELAAVGVDNLTVTLSGLPAGYVLTRGDQIGFAFGANPLRYSLHRVHVGGTAAGNGTLSVVLSTFVPEGVAAGVPVQLVRPAIKAKLVEPATYALGRPLITGGASFTFTQTLR